MKWTSSKSTEWDTSTAIDALCSDVSARVAEPDLVVVFCSRAHQTRFAQIPMLLRERFPNAVILGCSARGVIGGGKEVEEEPGASLVVAELPGVELRPFRVPEDARNLPRETWQELTGEEPSALIVFTDSYSCDSDALMSAFNAHLPGVPVVGGLASSASHPGSNALFLNDEFHRDGGVGIALSGAVDVDILVAQGCRPVGEIDVVARAQGNVIVELESGRPDDWIDSLYDTLEPQERDLVPRSLFVGVRRGEEWLVRTIVGVEPNSGAMTLTERLKKGDEVRFFLRDASTSREDLEGATSAYAARVDGSPEGGFLFSCIGRGVGLYGEPDHDSGLFRDEVGDVPLGGFFCAGEFGPIDGKNYVHGYTSTFALFRASDGGTA